MAYIKVNVNSMLSYGELFDSVKNASIEVRNQFVSLVNDLDWAVKKCDGIYDSARSITSELEKECKSLHNMCEFTRKSGQVYSILDKNTVNLHEESKSTGGISAEATSSTNSKKTLPHPKNSLYTEHISTAYNVFSVVSQAWSTSKLVDLGFVGSAIFGFNDLIIERINKISAKQEEIDRINNNPILTKDEKSYMKDVVEILHDIDAGLDSVSWATGCIPVVGDIISFAADNLSDGLNSEAVKDELFEAKQEIDDAKEQLENADGLFETIGAGVKVAYEYVEAYAEVTTTWMVETSNEIFKGACEVVNTVFVKPAKAISNLFSCW